MAPRERAWIAAERLAASGLSKREILEQLVAEGHPRDEAMTVVGALPEPERGPTRDEADRARRTDSDRGHFLLMLSAPLIAGGVLLLLTIAPIFGGLTALVGLVVLASGAWRLWRGAQPG